MLLAILHFWKGSKNTFRLRCGMLMPTLFGVATIAGLQLTGEVFDPFADTDNLIGFNSKQASFTNFINNHFDEATTEAFGKEHVAFLSLWLSHFIFCSSSLQVAKSFITLANQLHAGRNFFLN